MRPGAWWRHGLGRLRLQPLRHRRRLPARERGEDVVDRGHHLDHRAVLGLEESVLDPAIDLREEAVEVALDVHQHQRLHVDGELVPRGHLAEFVEGAEASGKRHERIRVIGHELLALVHRRHHGERRQSRMPHLAHHELLGDDTDHRPARRECRLRRDLHEAHAAAAVHERGALRCERAAEVHRRLRIRRARSRIRATEKTDPLHCFSARYAATAARCAGVIGRPHFVRRHSTSSAVRAHSSRTR